MKLLYSCKNDFLENKMTGLPVSQVSQLQYCQVIFGILITLEVAFCYQLHVNVGLGSAVMCYGLSVTKTAYLVLCFRS